jgi:hypothetical protein
MSHPDFSPDIKVVTLGRARIQLVENLPIMPGVNYSQIIGADYFWEDYVWSPAPINREPLIKDISRIKHGLSAPVLEGAWLHVENDLKNINEVKSLVLNHELEIISHLHGADMVLLVISLDCAMSYAASEIIAELSRDTGALTIAMMGTPYPCYFRSATLNLINHAASMMNCAITTEGLWSLKNDGRTMWYWGYEVTALNDLLWCATKSKTDFDSLKQLLTEPDRPDYGYSITEVVGKALNLCRT